MHRLFFGWQILSAALLGVSAWTGVGVWGIRPGRFFSLLLFLLLDVLWLIVCVTLRTDWIGTAAGEAVETSSPAVRRRYALFHLLLFLAATAAQMCYCFSSLSFMNNSLVQDSVVSAALFCVAALAAEKIRLRP